MHRQLQYREGLGAPEHTHGAMNEGMYGQEQRL
jgi:hypothetical protein